MQYAGHTERHRVPSNSIGAHSSQTTRFVVTERALFATSGALVATGRHQSGGLLHHKVVDPDDFGHPMEFWAYQ